MSKTDHTEHRTKGEVSALTANVCMCPLTTILLPSASDPLLKLDIRHLMLYLRDLAPEGLSIAGYLGRTDEWENLEVSYPRPVDRLHMLLKGWLGSREDPSNPHTWEYFIEVVENVGKGQVAERIGRAVFEGDTSV